MVGIVLCYVMAWARQNALVQGRSAITAYSAFIVADEILHVSGVMAVIGAGIVVGGTIDRLETPGTRISQ